MMIDIFIPTYNRPEKLERCLESIAPEIGENFQKFPGGAVRKLK